MRQLEPWFIFSDIEEAFKKTRDANLSASSDLITIPIFDSEMFFDLETNFL